VKPVLLGNRLHHLLPRSYSIRPAAPTMKAMPTPAALAAAPPVNSDGRGLVRELGRVTLEVSTRSRIRRSGCRRDSSRSNRDHLWCSKSLPCKHLRIIRCRTLLVVITTYFLCHPRSSECPWLGCGSGYGCRSRDTGRRPLHMLAGMKCRGHSSADMECSPDASR
jgi:hypothetical protein